MSETIEQAIPSETVLTALHLQPSDILSDTLATELVEKQVKPFSDEWQTVMGPSTQKLHQLIEQNKGALDADTLEKFLLQIHEYLMTTSDESNHYRADVVLMTHAQYYH